MDKNGCTHTDNHTHRHKLIDLHRYTHKYTDRFTEIYTDTKTNNRLAQTKKGKHKQKRCTQIYTHIHRQEIDTHRLKQERMAFHRGGIPSD